MDELTYLKQQIDYWEGRKNALIAERASQSVIKVAEDKLKRLYAEKDRFKNVTFI